jgi:hypothetical protein
MFKSDIKAYTKCVLQIIEIGNVNCINRAILSWLKIVEYMRSVIRTYPL